MKTLLRMACALGLVGVLGSCIFIDDTDHCPEGATTCNDSVIEECIDDRWEAVDDCWWLCGGYCAFDQHGRPLCVC